MHGQVALPALWKTLSQHMENLHSAPLPVSSSIPSHITYKISGLPNSVSFQPQNRISPLFAPTEEFCVCWPEGNLLSCVP